MSTGTSPGSGTAADAAFLDARPLLFSVAYRMLGSAADAEDVVQDAWLRLRGAQDVRDVRAYLVAVVTRLSLDQLRSARVRRERYVGPWLPEPVLTGVATDSDPLATVERRDLLSLGALALLERLGPRERAVVVLHEGLGWGHAQIADTLAVRPATSRQMLARARRRLGADPRPAPEVDRRQQVRLTAALVEAFETGRVDALVCLLREDTVLVTDGGGEVQAALRPILGRDKVLRFLAAVLAKAPAGLHLLGSEVNGEPAVVVHVGGSPAYTMSTVLDGERIVRLLLVGAPSKLRYATGQGLRRPDAQPL